MDEPLDLTTLRSRLAEVGGPRYWRSLEELAATPEFGALVEREFPSQLPAWNDISSRRDFLRLMAASLALAGVTGCTREPEEKIVPYVRAAEEMVPGRPRYFATAMPRGGYGLGVLAESHMGRPTKIEGNPDHPASLGATDVFAQASILGLYDPDRSQTVMQRGAISTWNAFLTVMSMELPALEGRGGKGLRLLTETITSPTLASQIEQLLEKLPEAQWHQYQGVGDDNVHAGAELAFGRRVQCVYHFDQAEVILSLGADFLVNSPGSVRYARDFIDGRRVANDAETMNRLYVAESACSLTGAMADHRIAVRPHVVEGVARAIASELEVDVRTRELPAEVSRAWIDAVVADLTEHRGSSLVVAGAEQPPAVHAVAHAMNDRLGNVGRTVTYHEPVEAESTDQRQSLAELVEAMNASEVEALIILGGNPVYSASGQLGFADALTKVKLRVHLSDYYDETSFLCDWHLPAAHYLESWGDVRSFDGTASIVQPLIAPLYGGRTPYEVLSILLGEPGRLAYEMVQSYWQEELGEEDFGQNWQRAVHDGLVPDTSSAEVEVSLQWSGGEEESSASTDQEPAGSERFDLVFVSDPTVWDGCYANNGWLQELPKPLSKITWENPIYIAPPDAERLGLASGDVVEITLNERSITGPVWILPGHAAGCLTLTLGYGRTRSGRIGTGLGYNAYAIRPADSPGFAAGATLRKTGGQRALATTQNHHTIAGRDLVRVTTLDRLQDDPRHLQAHGHHGEHAASLYPEFQYEGNAWGMVIDQTACIGCNACVVACQAENNIPVVGREQVLTGREMHWLRIDRYYYGDLDAGETYFQPMLCMHCEKAPCEVVCPVAATVHSAEGLNDMVYNRCVGTRYCSNNCPYKVRRFNYLQFTDAETPSLKLLRNPDVTVRSRGVMEKCTYCVQRINAARIEAKKENRPIRDGEVVTACQGACPTQAIIFGNINDPESEVRRLKESPVNYGLLTELNTQPRTTYLARVVNPNANLPAPAAAEAGHERDLDTPAGKARS